MGLCRLSDATGSTETATIGAALALYYRETFGQAALLDQVAQADQLEAPERRSVRGQKIGEGTETAPTPPQALLNLPAATEMVEASPAVTEQDSQQADTSADQPLTGRRAALGGTQQIERPPEGP